MHNEEHATLWRTGCQLAHNALGQLVFTAAEGQAQVVTPVRAFAISAPDECISLVNETGHEVLWIERLADFPETARTVLQTELAQRDFMPVIEAITTVASYAVPSLWTVQTDRGPTQFVLKAEEDIRRLAGNALLIADGQGVQYLIRDRLALDDHSRRILKRFL
jgi:hypothetical protein